MVGWKLSFAYLVCLLLRQIVLSCISKHFFTYSSQSQVSKCPFPPNCGHPLAPHHFEMLHVLLHLSCSPRIENCVTLTNRSQIFGDLGLDYHHPFPRSPPLVKEAMNTVFHPEHNHTALLPVTAYAHQHEGKGLHPAEVTLRWVAHIPKGTYEAVSLLWRSSLVVYQGWRRGDPASCKTSQFCLASNFDQEIPLGAYQNITNSAFKWDNGSQKYW